MNLLALLADSGASPSPVPMWNPLESGSTVDDHMQFVYTWIFWVSVGVGVLVAGALLYAFVRFRRRSDDEDPEQTHGSTKLEWTWTLTPYAILMVLFVISALNMVYIQGDPAPAAANGTPPLQITVIGEQFSWSYVYTDYKIVKGARSGQYVGGAQDLYVPADTPIELHIVSSDSTFFDDHGNRVSSGCSITADANGKPADQDLYAKEQKEKAKGTAAALILAEAISDQGCGVNHSFFIPSLAGQMNAIPGQVNYLWFDARAGEYYGQCTELCGSGHAKMEIDVHALNSKDWNKWLHDKQEPAS